MTVAWRVLAVLIVAYLMFGGLLACSQRALIYQPAREPPNRAQVGLDDMAAVTVTTEDGLALLAWYRAAETEDAPTLLYLHGNAGHLGYRAGKVRPYLDAGYGVLLLSWRGYGGNPGRPTEDGLYADARAAQAFLADQGVTHERLVVYGESIGGGPAVQLASDENIAALVLEAPFVSLPEVAQHHYPFLPARWLVRDKFASIDKIADISAPLLVVHGARDRIIPVAHGRALLEAASAPKEGVFVTKAGHNDLYDHGAQLEVLDFLERQLN